MWLKILFGAVYAHMDSACDFESGKSQVYFVVTAVDVMKYRDTYCKEMYCL